MHATSGQWVPTSSDRRRFDHEIELCLAWRMRSSKLDAADPHRDFERERGHFRICNGGYCTAAFLGGSVCEHRTKALRQRRGEVLVELLPL